MKSTFSTVWPLLALATCAAAFAADKPRLVEGIVVRVNDRIVTTEDVRKRAAEKAAETGHAVPADVYPDLIQDVANELCLLERATELKVEVNNEEVENEIKRVKEQNHITDQDSFDKALRTWSMTLDQLKTRIHDSILINRLLFKEVGDTPITEEELKQRYAKEQDLYRIGERVHLQHIVFPAGSEADSQQKVVAGARRLAAAARASNDFVQLVQHEVQAGNASGGDLGVVLITDLRPEVRDAVANLKAGEISDPFLSSAGIHVARVAERIPPSLKPFQDVVEELRQREMADRYRAHLASVVEGLKKRYVVEVHPELMVSGK